MTTVEARALTVASALVHFESFAKIEDKAGNLVRVAETTEFQQRIYDAYEYLLGTNQPVRIIAAPKPRQSGGSTAVGHICYHHTRRFKVHGMVMADEFDRVKKLWAMFQRFADNDGFAAEWDSTTSINTEEARFLYSDPDGTKRKALWEWETANDPKAGASGTRRVLWFSEAMRYKREGDASDTLVIGNALNSLPHEPGTVVFLESTAEGNDGYAVRIHQGAVTLEERMQGKLGNGWVKVFCAWHECKDYALERSRPENARWFDDTDEAFVPLRSAEEAGRIEHHWTPEQIAWRRMKIVGELQGALFDRDYPDSEASAFRASTQQRFDLAGLAALKEMCDVEDATPAHQRAVLGDLIEQDDRGLVWAPHAAGFVWMCEPSEPGRRYIAFCDPMTGAQSEGSLKRDTHGAGILGLAWVDERGVEHDDEVVAVLHHDGGCRWDNDVLAARLSMLARHYGDPMIIVEANNSGTEVMRLLLLAGRNLWRREKPNHRLPGKKMLDVVGFQTNTATKSYWIGALSMAIRERTLVCRYRMAVEQFTTFILDEAGRGAAQAGCFDDFVTGVGLGLFARGSAKLLPIPAPFRQPQTVGGAWS